MPLCCPDNSETLSGCCRNQCPDAAEICTQIIKARNDSGKSIKKFCEDAGISRHAYFYWQRKLREVACNEFFKAEKPNIIEEESKEIIPNGWIKLNKEEQKNTDDNILIEINGCHIIVKGNTDFELLKSVCGVLKSL